MQEVSDADLVFIALHGGVGENGDVQRVLENAEKRFTGSGSDASSLALDKPRSKTLARELEIATPEWVEFPVTDDPETLRQTFLTAPGLPLILKPADGGSTVGLTLAREQSQIPKALEILREHCRIGMAEEFVAGRELTVAVFEGEPFEVVEIKPRSELYDYQAKYTEGGSEYFCPAEIDSTVRDKVRTVARLMYQEVGCEGLARVDYILDAQGIPQFLEINTIPGMTDLSLAPMSAKGAGISFAELLSKSLQSALRIQ
jgi:D-alanine-D-alanine ligase